MSNNILNKEDVLNDNTDIITEINLCDDLDLSEWKSYKFTYNKDILEKKYGLFKIIKKNLINDSTKPDLVVISEFSKKSFCGTTKRIIENIDQIKNIFNGIYILQFDEDKIKDLQSKAYSIRDEIRKSKNEADFEENLDKIYQSETDLNEELGIIIDKLLRSIGLTKVHLLGKGEGGGIAIHVLTKSNIYDALYLAVPASPTAIKHLVINNKNIQNKLLIFTWDQRDAYQFDWNKKSNEEITRYEKYIPYIKFNINTIITKRFHTDTDETDSQIYHEVPNGLFELITKYNTLNVYDMIDLCHLGDNSAPGIIINDILKDKKQQLFMLGIYNFNDILSYFKDGNYESIYDKKNLTITSYNNVIHNKYNFSFLNNYKVINSQIINYDFVYENYNLKIKNFKEMLSSVKLCVFIVFTLDADHLKIKEMLDWLSLNKKHFHLMIFTSDKHKVKYKSKLYSIIKLKNYYYDWWRFDIETKLILYNEIYEKFINCLKKNKIEHNFPLTFDNSNID